MAGTVAANRLELLQIADAVARDKSIDKSVVLTAMEEAMQRAAKAHYGAENDIKVDIDPKTGETHVSRYLHVVELVENDKTEISLEDARRRNPDAQIGDIIAETLPPVDFNRINAQNAKQVIVQKVRDAERERQFDEYKDRIGEVVHGVVKRSEFGSVVVDLGRAEGVVRRDEMIPRESFRTGDRIRAYIYDVRRETRGPQIFLSRSHPQFMVRLFAQEVPEIYDGVIEIRAVARDPGSRAKIAVISKDSSIDPVGACVGMRGVRVQAVVQELQGERIDIIPWNSEAATFIVNALAPAEVSKVVLDEDTHRVEVVVPDEQLSLGIGRRGQNVRLASQLTGWQIDILTEAEESERRQKEFATRTQLFMESLDVDETVAQLLASEGFATIEDVAYVDAGELAQIDAFDEETANELQNRAIEFIDARNKEMDDKRLALGVEDAVLEVEGVTPAMAVALGEGGVKTLEDLAGAATDELMGYYEVGKDKERVRVPGALEGFNLSSDDANAIIMKARVKIGWVEEEAPAEEEVLDDAPEEGAEILMGEAAHTLDEDEAMGHSLIAAGSRADARERRDIVSGETMPEHRLIRFVADPDGQVVPDVAAKLPGRGLWVEATRAAIDKAVEKKLFARGAKRSASGGEQSVKVQADATLADRAEKALLTRMIGDLGLARRSGALVMGFDNVLRALDGPKTPPDLLIEASDGSRDGKRKLYNAAHARDLKPYVLECLSSAELGLALGRENVIHAAVQPGGLCERLMLDAQRLNGLRNLSPAVNESPRRGPRESKS